MNTAGISSMPSPNTPKKNERIIVQTLLPGMNAITPNTIANAI